MKTKIIIKTPPKQAGKAQRNIKPFIIGMKKVKIVTYVNKEESEMVWDVKGSVKDILKINKNVALFDNLMKGAFNNKAVDKLRKKVLSEDDNVTLTDMLLKQTKVEVIKEASAQEIVEFNKTWWERMKERFVKKEG